MEYISNWLKKQLSNPQIVFLTVVLIVVLLLVNFAGDILAPLIWSIVIAYLLEGVIKRTKFIPLPRTLKVWFVFIGFVCILLSIVFGLLPLLYNQVSGIVRQLPAIITAGQSALETLPERYPDLFSLQQVEQIMYTLRNELTDMGHVLLTNSISGVTSIITILVYLILLPILVFFLLKDKVKILNWIKDFLPSNNQLTIHIWHDVDKQIGNYIRGKFWEILIVWFVCYVSFTALGLEFAMLISLLVGLSVIVPYIGAAVVTVPVVLMAWFQWGFSNEFLYLVGTYFVIQTLDGNLLVPLLFSEAVNIHPVAIIVSVLVFGGIWGFWGIFFAIPLATLVKAVINAWPHAGLMHENSADKQT